MPATPVSPALDDLTETLPKAGPSGPRLQVQQVFTETTDAAASTSTVYTLEVNDELDGRISTANEHDWVRVDLVQGQTYVFQLWGRNGSANGLDDTYLRLRDANGNEIASNDDADNPSGVRFSSVTYTATSTGPFYLDVSAFDAEIGDYTLQVSTNVFDVDEVANFIGEYFWGSPTPFTFDATPTSGAITYNIDALTPEGQQLALWAFEIWGQTTGLLFTRTSGLADIRLDDNQSGAFAGPTGGYNPNTGDISYSTVNIGTSWLSSYGTTIDSYSFLTYLHEIGHALGLGHGGLYDGSATFGSDALYLTDSYQMTIMSYFDVFDNTFVNGVDGRPVTPMLADLLAIALNYGLPDVFSGNTIWGANNNLGGLLGQLFSMLTGEIPVDPNMLNGGIELMLTIADSGGLDTVDVSFSTANQRVDLRGGTFSDIDGVQNNIAISSLSVIENAFGGSGNDTITGNDAANRLEGRSGNDSINGGAQADTLVGGSGNDVLNGETGNDRIEAGLGNDMAYGGDGNDTVFASFGNDTVDGGIGNDQLFGEDGNDSLIGADGNDTLQGGIGNDVVDGGIGNDSLFGDANADTLRGGGGNDFLYGGSGNDRVEAGLGDDLAHAGDDNDVMFGADGNDTLDGGNGNDVVYGQEGNDSLVGSAGNDLLEGGTGNDQLNGGVGNDTLYGEADADTLRGGGDHDLLYGGDGNDRVEGAQGNDIAFGDAGNDTMFGSIGNDTMWGGNNDDVLYGENDRDFLTGEDGRDNLQGGNGIDTLNGGAGNDTLYGGADADTFVFYTTDGTDVIQDFSTSGGDVVVLLVQGSGPFNFSQMLSLTSEVNGGTLIDFGGGNSIYLANVLISQLSADDFQYFVI